MFLPCREKCKHQSTVEKITPNISLNSSKFNLQKRLFAYILYFLKIFRYFCPNIAPTSNSRHVLRPLNIRRPINKVMSKARRTLVIRTLVEGAELTRRTPVQVNQTNFFSLIVATKKMKGKIKHVPYIRCMNGRGKAFWVCCIVM